MNGPWRYALASDAGRVRFRNEDAVRVLEAQGVAIVADGLGGHPNGDRASQLAVEAVAAAAAQQRGECGGDPAAEALRRLVTLANARVLAQGRDEPSTAGMATTLVVARFLADSVAVAHVGDSRAYRLRAGHLELLTRDHNVLEERLSAGAGDRAFLARDPNAPLLTRVVGAQPGVTPSVGVWDAAPGDVWLLCTDGLHGEVPETVIGAILADFELSPERQAQALVSEANARGGWDNVTVVVAQRAY